MSAGQCQFTVDHTWRGLVIMVRRRVPTDIPGVWEWSPWRRAGKTELAEIMSRLSRGSN